MINVIETPKPFRSIWGNELPYINSGVQTSDYKINDSSVLLKTSGKVIIKAQWLDYMNFLASKRVYYHAWENTTSMVVKRLYEIGYGSAYHRLIDEIALMQTIQNKFDGVYRWNGQYALESVFYIYRMGYDSQLPIHKPLLEFIRKNGKRIAKSYVMGWDTNDFNYLADSEGNIYPYDVMSWRKR